MAKRKPPTKVSFREGRGVYRSNNANKGCAVLIVAALGGALIIAAGITYAIAQVM